MNRKYSAHFKYTVLEYVRENAGKESIPRIAKKFEMPTQTLYGWIYHNEELLDLLNATGFYSLNKFLYGEPRILKTKEDKHL
ncbi:hypothetical protein EGW53_09160 [Enterococcus faecium]|uniref:Transposase n=1 Tax=Enterococcus faecium TaxID=1352 RepID=A0A3F3NKF4_ENTFC|nr:MULTISPECIES: hypothetical protein [Bacteria]EMF0154913.1 hypothetical protein [Enterococcus hirae]EME7197333.1 hypothetical protein [Enterococcus faecium]MDB7249274.1 hypothetical protein [Enterococcus faecium]MDB7254427.1 hypothetical protein [Enterococcus faecium]MDB7256888.1 hypothetical protein [Enterococcus faecium]